MGICRDCGKSTGIRTAIKLSNGAFFYRDPKSGRKTSANRCLRCMRLKQRKYRENKNNAATKKYEKTHKGFLMRLYRNMKSRVTGVQKLKLHLYEGLYLLPKEDFYEWAINNRSFKALFTKYKNSGYQRRFAPSVDRIDSTKGYFLKNMEFVTMAENSRRGNISRYQKAQK